MVIYFGKRNNKTITMSVSKSLFITRLKIEYSNYLSLFIFNPAESVNPPNDLGPTSLICSFTFVSSVVIYLADVYFLTTFLII